MTKTIQANVYVTASERDAFETYAQHFLLDAAGLLALLFAREMRVERLPELLKEDVAAGGNRKPKITAHLHGADHDQVRALAECYEMSLSSFGAVLVRAELREQWLGRVLTTRFES